MSELLDNIGLANLTEQQLEALVSLRVPEGQRLDFKRELKLAKNSEKRDLCKDVSAFANSRGGWLLVGIEEGPNSEAAAIVGVEPQDKLHETVEQIITSGITPRIQHFDLRMLTLGSGKAVLLIKVERDGDLHQVGYDDNRYYKRVHRTTVVMDPADMKGFFSGGANIQTRKEEIEESRSNFEQSAQNLLEGDSGVMSLFLAPEVPPTRLPLFEQDQNLLTQLHPIYCSGWDYRRHQSSYSTFALGSEKKLPRTFAEIFDTGTIQAAESFALRPREGKRFVPSVAFEQELIRSVHKYLHLLNGLGAPPPVWLGVSLLNVRDYVMFVDPAKYWADLADDHSCKQDDVQAALLHVPSADVFEDLEAVAALMRPAFDEIWRAFNFGRSLNYDDDGRWNPA